MYTIIIITQHHECIFLLLHTLQLFSQVQRVENDGKLALGEALPWRVAALQVDVVKVDGAQVGSSSGSVDDATGSRGFQLVQQQLC